MNKTKKYTLALLGFFTTFLSACSQYGDPYKDVPKEINGHPVYEVPFEQPLIIDPKKEQVFYFKLNKKFEIGNPFNIRTVVLRPDSNIVTKHIVDGVEQYKTQEIPKYAKYRNLDRELVEKGLLQFEMSLQHFDKQGKEVKVGLKEGSISYYLDVLQKSANKKHPIRFESKEKYFTAKYPDSLDNRKIGNEDYLSTNIIVAGFLIQDIGGYYKLTVRPLKQYPDYPKLKLGIYVNIERTPK
mgnify:FL=1